MDFETPMRIGPHFQYTCTEQGRTVFHGGPILMVHLNLSSGQ